MIIVILVEKFPEIDDNRCLFVTSITIFGIFHEQLRINVGLSTYGYFQLGGSPDVEDGGRDVTDEAFTNGHGLKLALFQPPLHH
jgi:hypothetical protein